MDGFVAFQVITMGLLIVAVCHLVNSKSSPKKEKRKSHDCYIVEHKGQGDIFKTIDDDKVFVVIKKGD